ncbi:hypothetical protein [Paenibacillus xylanilyticus]|uniref:hypothetical protein n=1 Tax=Paenibacillus xylanilyticus TaxID=248903 RepID=UPI0039A2DDAD
MRLKHRIKLGFLAFTLGCTTIGVSFVPPTASAASVPASKAVYSKFQIYWKNAKNSSSSLIQARKYLTNHIKEVSPWQATLMTLQLENVQKIKLAEMDETIYSNPVQSALFDAHSKMGYEQKLTYSSLLKEIKDPSIRSLLQEASDLGFKLETSEGIYYPIINYGMYKKFQPYVKPDIAAYINIMADESNQATISDAAISVTWDELIRRTLEKEAFLRNFPNSNRTSAIQNSLIVHYIFYGSDNSPAYDWYTDEEVRTLDPEVKNAYEKVIKNRDANTQSVLLDTIEQIVELLNQNHDELTPQIQKMIESVEDQFVNS